MQPPLDPSLPQQRAAEVQDEPRERRKAVWNTPEFGILCIGLAAWLAILCWAFLLWHVGHPERARALLSTVGVHVTGGRAMGVSWALSVHFSRTEAILLASMVETGVVCVFFSIFLFSARRFVRVPWLDNALDNVRRTAAEHHSRLAKWGVTGLFLFVWFPFFMTGPVVGSVIGFLLGLQPYVTVGVVLAGTFTAIIFWTLAIGPIVEWAARIGQTIPMMIVLLLCVFIVAGRWRQHTQNRANRRKHQPGAEKESGEAADSSLENR